MESISSLSKRLEVQGKEHSKNAANSRPTERSNSGLHLKLTNELFDLETFLLQKKIDLAKIKIEKIDLELAAKNDAIESLDLQLQNKKTTTPLHK